MGIGSGAEPDGLDLARLLSGKFAPIGVRPLVVLPKAGDWLFPGIPQPHFEKPAKVMIGISPTYREWGELEAGEEKLALEKGENFLPGAHWKGAMNSER